MLKIKYNGRRFPRTMVLNGHKVKAFHRDRLVLELEDYDAYSLLRSNIRLAPGLWEFNVVGVAVPKKAVEKKPEPPKEEKAIEETAKAEPPKEEKPKRPKKKKAMNPTRTLKGRK